MIRIIVADDHRLVRRSVLSLLRAAPEVDVIGEAENGDEAVALVKELQPDLIVMDVSMPRQDGITATQRIKELGVPTQVLMLSIYDNRALVQQALKSGARGYVLKRTLSADLLKAIHQVKRGGIYLSSGLDDRWRTPPGGAARMDTQEL